LHENPNGFGFADTEFLDPIDPHDARAPRLQHLDARTRPQAKFLGAMHLVGPAVQLIDCAGLAPRKVVE